MANKFTDWDFAYVQMGESCMVGTVLQDRTGLEMYVCYTIADERTQLNVYAPLSGYDWDFIFKKLGGLTQKYPVGVGMLDEGEEMLGLGIEMSLLDFENEMYVIVSERMTAMVEVMTEIINHDRENKDMMECYTVGNVYQKAVNHQEAPVFDMDDCGITLNVYIRKPATHEVEQFASGKPFEMRLAQLRNIIFPMFRFSDMGWMDAPYNVHLSRNLSSLEVPADGHGLGMTVHLYDTATGKLLCNRLISLSTEISRGLVKMVAEQAQKPFNRQEYADNLAGVYAAYPTKKLLGMAAYSYRLK